ncbi:hypothetical protein LSCM1_01348 [Leishmania martiniquensis]|uniref:Uncharacterized protein n=1 Tax=Leishmania martiniquensis TaxID=1580590 RepID=A0A836KHU5_9TRYP|nr:hypothetical protein LSCM1_01348 [Leishmania martiniquensis]
MAVHLRGYAARSSVDPGVFFPEGSRPAQPLHGHGFLLHGARAVGKTSLAFQAAINTVQCAGGSVVVLCQESALYAKVPQPFTPLSTLSEAALGRIEFIYVESWTAALREMMGFRTTRAVPTLVLVDDDGFEVTATADRRSKRAGQNSEVLFTSAIASCLSYLENVHEWMNAHSRVFFYVLVTNHLPESATQLSLPYSAFPLVSVWIGASGTVHITPTTADRAAAGAAPSPPPAYLTWRNRLCMRS